MKSLMCDTPVDSIKNLLVKIVIAAHKINITPGIFDKVRQSFFDGANYEMTHMVATFNTC